MMDRFRQAFAPPVFEDEETNQQARRLNAFLLIDFFLLIGLAVICWLDRRMPRAIVALLVGAIGLFPVLYVLMRRGAVRIATYLLPCLVTVCLTGALLIMGTARTPIVSGYFLIILTLGLIRDRRAAVAILAFNVVLGSMVGLFDMLGPDPNRAGLPAMSLTEWITLIVLLVYAAVVTYTNRRGFMEAYDRVQREVYESSRVEAALRESEAQLRASEQKLRRSGQFTQDMLDALEDPVLVKNRDGSWLMVNQAAHELLKYFGPDLVGKSDRDFFPPEIAETYVRQDQQVLETGETIVFEENILVDNQPRTIATKKSRFIDPVTGEAYIALIIRDITERQRAREALENEVAERTTELRAMNESLIQEIEERQRVEAALRASEERYALAARGANDGLWDLDLTTNILYLSPRWKDMLGFPMNGQPGVDLLEMWMDRIHPEDREFVHGQIEQHLRGQAPQFECEFRILHQDGSYRWMLSRGIAVRDAEERPSRIAGSMTDITERKRIESQLMIGAFYDAATGLPNRALLTDRLEQAIHIMKRHPEERFAVLYMDLDRFKDVNDSLGHSAGDELLIAVAQRVKETLRSTDTLARLGGDEFVILLPSIIGLEDALHVADRIKELFRQPFELSALPVITTASVGIVIGDDSHAHAEDVLRDADIAMYRAKMNGKARYQVFDASMRSQALSRIQIETDLRKTLENCSGYLLPDGGDSADLVSPCADLSVYYQPIVQLDSGKLHGFEALTRWKHPTRGFIVPDEFIPIAEDSLLILPLDLWAMRQACIHVKAWQQRFADPMLAVSVNISGKHFTQPNLVGHLQAILRETMFPPVCLRLEITESAIMENIETATHTLRQIQAMGVQIQIDDFGTGFSSLTYLFQIPFNTLKIDRSFVSQLGHDRRKAEIVSTIVRLAHNIGMDVVAEGVETLQQAAQLKSMGCDYAQGFLYSRALDPDGAARVIKEGIVGK